MSAQSLIMQTRADIVIDYADTLSALSAPSQIWVLSGRVLSKISNRSKIKIGKIRIRKLQKSKVGMMWKFARTFNGKRELFPLSGLQRSRILLDLGGSTCKGCSYWDSADLKRAFILQIIISKNRSYMGSVRVADRLMYFIKRLAHFIPLQYADYYINKLMDLIL